MLYRPSVLLALVCSPLDVEERFANTASAESPRLDHKRSRSGSSPKMAKAKLNLLISMVH